MSFMVTLPAPVSSVLRRLRWERCLSRRQLAELAGLSLNTIWKLESGRTTYPTARTMEKLALGLGIEVGMLRRHVGMHPSRGEPLRLRQLPSPVAHVLAPGSAETVSNLLAALLSRWSSFTPAQREYAVQICEHAFTTLCVLDHALLEEERV